MDTNGISYLNFLYFLIFLIPMMAVTWKMNLSVNKRLVIAVSRMILQLSLVGIFLQYIFKLDKGWLNLLYVFLMMLVASFSVMKSCNRKEAPYLPIILFSFALPNTVMMLFFNRFIADIDVILSAQHTIPIAGMLLGNSLNSIIIAVNRFYSDLKEGEKEYFMMLGMSGSRSEAIRPYFRTALLTALNPTLASIETIGLVALPGMMTGQILGGALPLTAIKYQIAIMLAIMIVRFAAAALTIFMTTRLAFDDFDIPAGP
ncbi:MAG: ABC transporter permease [Spirochaetales bacterium]|nr:ABC transporter permease [Spirochaetales bacterium]